MKIGLVLEGGGMRGLYTAGVLDTFLEHEIKVDGIIGASAGALFGVDYCSRQKGRALRYTSKYVGDKRYMSVHSLLTTGNFVNKDFAYYEVPNHLDPFDEEAFENSGIDYYAAITNVDTGEVEYVKIQNLLKEMEVLRASSALPFISKYVEMNGKRYLDGAIVDSIPVEKFIELGYDKIIVVLTRPIEYRKKAMNPILIKAGYGKHKKFAEQLINRHQHYNDTVEKLIEMERKGDIFVIRPSLPIAAGRTEKDPEKLKAAHSLGVKDCLEMLPALEQYLESVECRKVLDDNVKSYNYK